MRDSIVCNGLSKERRLGAVLGLSGPGTPAELSVKRRGAHCSSVVTSARPARSGSPLCSSGRTGEAAQPENRRERTIRWRGGDASFEASLSCSRNDPMMDGQVNDTTGTFSSRIVIDTEPYEK